MSGGSVRTMSLATLKKLQKKQTILRSQLRNIENDVNELKYPQLGITRNT
jgi:hypothetical protein